MNVALRCGRRLATRSSSVGRSGGGSRCDAPVRRRVPCAGAHLHDSRGCARLLVRAVQAFRSSRLDGPVRRSKPWRHRARLRHRTREADTRACSGEESGHHRDVSKEGSVHVPVLDLRARTSRHEGHLRRLDEAVARQASSAGRQPPISSPRRVSGPSIDPCSSPRRPGTPIDSSSSSRPEPCGSSATARSSPRRSSTCARRSRSRASRGSCRSPSRPTTRRAGSSTPSTTRRPATVTSTSPNSADIPPTRTSPTCTQSGCCSPSSSRGRTTTAACSSSAPTAISTPPSETATAAS